MSLLWNKCPCCMSRSVRRVHVLTGCPSTCCMSQYILHVPVHPARPSTCCTSMSMLYVHVYAACPCPRCMDLNIQHRHGHGYAVWTLARSMDVECSVIMSVVHIPVSCVSMSKLHVPVHVTAHVYAACPWLCFMSTSMSVLFLLELAVLTWTCNIDLDMRHGDGHTACIGTGNMDMDNLVNEEVKLANEQVLSLASSVLDVCMK